MDKSMTSEKLQYKQNCADRLQAIARRQVECGRRIQCCDYIPTLALKEEMDHLIAEYDLAKDDFEKASMECNTPVYVAPLVVGRAG